MALFCILQISFKFWFSKSWIFSNYFCLALCTSDSFWYIAIAFWENKWEGKCLVLVWKRFTSQTTQWDSDPWVTFWKVQCWVVWTGGRIEVQEADRVLSSSRLFKARVSFRNTVWVDGVHLPAWADHLEPTHCPEGRVGFQPVPTGNCCVDYCLFLPKDN